MVVMVLLIVGLVAAFNLVSRSDSAIQAGITGDGVPGLEQDLGEAAAAAGEDVDIETYETAAMGMAALESGDVAFLIVDGTTVVTNDGASNTTTFITTTAITRAALRALVDEGVIAKEDIAIVSRPVDIEFEQLHQPNPDDDARSGVAYIGGLLLFVTIVMFGQFVAMGIVEEKANRVVEVVISRIETSSLLIGKVLGIGTLGLAQIGVFVGAGIVALLIVPTDTLPDIDLSAIGIPALLWIVVWFVLGYLLYSFIYAAVGATVSRQEELQGVAYIPPLLLMPAYFLSAFALGSDVGGLVRVASFVPLWSPILVPLRTTTGDASLWEVAVALVLVTLTIVATLRVATRVYRGAALRTGGKVKFTEALRNANG